MLSDSTNEVSLTDPVRDEGLLSPLALIRTETLPQAAGLGKSRPVGGEEGWGLSSSATEEQPSPDGECHILSDSVSCVQPQKQMARQVNKILWWSCFGAELQWC